MTSVIYEICTYKVESYKQYDMIMFECLEPEFIYYATKILPFV